MHFSIVGLCEFVVHSPPDGTAMRGYIHVCDLAGAHVLAFEHLLDNGDTIAVNLGTGHGVSVRQIIVRTRRVPGREIIARDAPRRSGDPPILVADPKKAGNVLDWAPEYLDLTAIITNAYRGHNNKSFSQ